jgi:subtilisin family serine protease
MRLKIVLLIMYTLIATVIGAQNIRVKRGPRTAVNIDTISINSFNSDKLFIKFKPGFDTFLKATIAANGSQKYKFGIQKLDALMQSLTITDIQRSFKNILSLSKNYNKHTAWELNRWYTIYLQKNTDIKTLIKKFTALSDIIEIAEPDYKRYLHDNGPSQWIPADSVFGQQWHFNHTAQQGATSPIGTDADIDLPEAWELEKGKPEVVVAVIDGGIDTSHPDLRQNLWIGNGGERFGYNFNNNTPFLAPNRHGTHVCGTIGAVNNNGIGISGIAGGDGSINSGARIMSLQNFDPTGNYAGDDATASAFVYAADHGAAIVQCSWGGGSPTAILTDAIDYFIMNGGGTVLNGGIAFFSAGNDRSEITSFPSDYPPVICVAATDYEDKKPGYSNYGPWVDIAAPGGLTSSIPAKGVLSTTPLSSGSYYGWNNGTSMACPHVSGVAALCISKSPGKMDNEQLRNILLSSVDDIYPLNQAYIGKLGTGRINAYLAVQNAANINGTAISPVASFTATQTCGNATFSWIKNASTNSVIIAESDTLLFGIPSTNATTGTKLVGGGTVVYNGNGTSFTKLLPINKKKYYRIWSYSNVDLSTHKTISVTHQVVVSTLSLQNQQDCDIDIRWSDATNCVTDSVMIIAHSSLPTKTPSGMLQVGDTLIGGAKVIYKGRANSFNYASTYDSIIYFQKWNFNASYEYTNPYKELHDTIIKPNAIKSFATTAATVSSISLSWQPITDADCFNGDSYLLIYNTSSNKDTPIGTYQTGDSLPAGGKVLYVGNSNSFTHSNLAPNTRYCYSLFRIRNNNEYSTGRQLCTNTVCLNSTITLPFADGFNGADNSLPDVCLWDIENSTGNPNAITIKTIGSNPSLKPVEGNSVLRFNAYNIQDMSARLSSRFIKKGVGNSMDVRFRWYQDSSNYTIPIFKGEGVLVQWSDDRINWKNLEFYPRVPVQGDTGWAYKQITLPNAAIIKDTIFLSFLFTSAYGNNCYLDDLNLQISSFKPANGVLTYAACESTDSTTNWTNYYDSIGDRLLSIKKNNNNIGKAGQKGFSMKVGGTASSTILHTTNNNYVSNPGGWAVMNRYFTITPFTEPSTNVTIRFYYAQQDFSDLANVTKTLSPARDSLHHHNLFLYKINNDVASYVVDPTLGHQHIPLALSYKSDGFTQYSHSNQSDSVFWNYGTANNNFHFAEYAVGYLKGGGGLGVGSIYGIGAKARVTYTFVGNGNWSDSSNWLNKNVPPNKLPADAVIIINPISGGECVLDIKQSIEANGVIIVKAGKRFRIMKGIMKMN